jgi:hypothetical protein
MCCPMAFAAFVTSGSWPTPIAAPSSPEFARHWTFLSPPPGRRQSITASATLCSPGGPSTYVRAAAAKWSRSQHCPDRLSIPLAHGTILHDRSSHRPLDRMSSVPADVGAQLDSPRWVHLAPRLSVPGLSPVTVFRVRDGQMSIIRLWQCRRPLRSPPSVAPSIRCHHVAVIECP